MKKNFIVTQEAYYSKMLKPVDEIIIQTDNCEVLLEWKDGKPHLKVFDDFKIVINEMNEAIPLLFDTTNREITTCEISDKLLDLGFKDITERIDYYGDKEIGEDIELRQFTPSSNWVTGSIDGYDFEAKHFDEYSQYGINFGRTSKLSLKKDDELIAKYDRGWDIEPTTFIENQILNTLVEYLDDLPKRFENGLTL